MLLNINEVYEGTEIKSEQVLSARKLGLMVHRDIQYKTESFLNEETDTWEDESVMISDRFFAADKEWVASYHDAGGTWGYND